MFAVNPTNIASETPESSDWLALARAGDAEAFGELCRVYENRLVRQAWVLCGNASLAEELAQDTLVEAWKQVRRYRGDCRFFTWLCAILLNRYRNTARQRRPIPFSALARPEDTDALDRAGQVSDSAVAPDEAAGRREQSALVLECLEQLPPKLQQVIHLRFYVDDSLEGIAAALNCPLGTVKSRLFNALEQLRAMGRLNRPVDPAQHPAPAARRDSPKP